MFNLIYSNNSATIQFCMEDCVAPIPNSQPTVVLMKNNACSYFLLHPCTWMQMLSHKNGEGLKGAWVTKLSYPLREGFKKKLIIFMEFSMGGGYPPSVQIINFLKQKIRPLQTVLNGLKHEKNQ